MPMTTVIPINLDATIYYPCPVPVVRIDWSDAQNGKAVQCHTFVVSKDSEKNGCSNAITCESIVVRGRWTSVGSNTRFVESKKC